MFQRLIESCSALFKLYMRTFRPTTQIFFCLITRMAGFLILAFITHIEFCSALWDFVGNVLRIMLCERTGALARRNLRAVLRGVNFPKSKHFLLHRVYVLSIDNFLGNNQWKNLHQLIELNPPLKFFHLSRLAHLV